MNKLSIFTFIILFAVSGGALAGNDIEKHLPSPQQRKEIGEELARKADEIYRQEGGVRSKEEIISYLISHNMYTVCLEHVDKSLKSNNSEKAISDIELGITIISETFRKTKYKHDAEMLSDLYTFAAAIENEKKQPNFRNSANYINSALQYSSTPYKYLTLQQAGIAYAGLGDYATATKYFAEVIENYPENKEIPRSLYLRAKSAFQSRSPSLQLKYTYPDCKKLIIQYGIDFKTSPEIYYMAGMVASLNVLNVENFQKVDKTSLNDSVEFLTICMNNNFSSKLMQETLSKLEIVKSQIR